MICWANQISGALEAGDKLILLDIHTYFLNSIDSMILTTHSFD